MKWILAAVWFVCASCQSGGAVASVQEVEEVVQPLRVSPAALSGLGLDPIEQPDQPGKEFFQRKIYYGPELGVFMVSTNSFTNQSESYPFDEYVYLLHGAAEVRTLTGGTQRFESRDHFVAPKGHAGEWENQAGPNLHYELSIISSRRSEATASAGIDHHRLIDPRTLSGVDIHLEGDTPHRQSVFAGAELHVALMAERPRTTTLEGSKERVVHLLSGQVTITSADSQSHTFHTGDFFVCPKGLSGTWRSDGHGIVKYLVVERAW